MVCIARGLMGCRNCVAIQFTVLQEKVGKTTVATIQHGALGVRRRELGVRRRALAGAGPVWLGGLRAAGAGRACVLGVPGARGRRRERAWRAGHAGARRASVLGREGRQAHGRWRARARSGERQLGAGAGGRQGVGRAASRRWARGARAACTTRLALGSALGALGPFSIRFDSFFFLSHQMNTVHCKIKFFPKKKKKFIKFK